MRILLVLLFLTVFLGGIGAWWYIEMILPKKIKPPISAIDSDLRVTSRENYLMLERAIQILEKILDDDETVPVLREKRKKEADALIKQYNQRQLH